MSDATYSCSGCGKRQNEVENLIALPGPAFICNECVDVLYEIEQRRRAKKSEAPERQTT
jgi:ATP-dependent protease Clp ATPase subunit